MRRQVIEFATQLGSVAVAIVDRIVVSGLLVRLWGVPMFEDWVLITSAVGMVSAFELGLNLYFNNKVALATAAGESKEAYHSFRVGNLFFTCILMLIFIVIVWLGVSGTWLKLIPISTVPNSEGFLALALLAIANGLRLSITVVSSLYRAHLEFARYNIIFSASEIARLFVIGAIALLGFGIVAAAAASAIVIVLGQIVVVMWDTSRRYPLYKFGFELPQRQHLGSILTISSAYFLQNLPTMLLSSLPALVLKAASPKVGDVAIFALIRMLTGFLRSIMTQLAIVNGLDCAQRFAIGDRTGLTLSFSRSSRVYSVMIGCVSGGLLIFGKPFFFYWTGSDKLYRLDLVIVMLLPLVLTGVSIMGNNFLQLTNKPLGGVFGRLGQLALTVLTFVTLSTLDDPVLRICIALAVGEIAGFALPIYISLAGVMPQMGLRFHLSEVAFTLGSCAFVLSIGDLLSTVVAPRQPLLIIVDVAVVAVACIPLLWWLGLDRTLRTHIKRAIESRLKKHLRNQ